MSFLEDSFLKLKERLQQEINSGKMVLDSVFMQELEQETKSVLEVCAILNKDDAFIQQINAKAQSKNKNLLLKAEHFFLSDCILAYSASKNNETERSQFALAYYYDVLKNNHFADKSQLGQLNALVLSASFQDSVQKIKLQNSILTTKSRSSIYFLPQVLDATNHAQKQLVLKKLEHFLELAFGQKFDKKDEFNQFLDLKKEEAVLENNQITNFPKADTLEKVLEELNGLVGLDNIKKDVKELINLLEIQKKRTNQGLKNIDITLHTVFLGPPGTGKTTVARLLSRIFKHLGFLSKGQLYETDREGMIAGFVGQTATKVDKVIEESVGGVLFIDEAYGLSQSGFGNDYGAEAVNTLLKRMEDHRDDLAVVVAGYTEPMKLFIESNPGLRSRFNRFFQFKHFTPAELYLIFEGFCKKSDFKITEDAKEKLSDTFELLHSKKDEGFGNARVVRNLFEKCIQNQANRIIALEKMDAEILSTFTEEDIPEPKDTLDQVYFLTTNE